MARLVDIANAAGVSVGLVSRVLNDKPSARATPQTRQRILAAAAKLDYRPNYAARALRLSRAHTIGVAVPDVTNPLFVPLITSIEREAGKRGFAVLLSRTESVRGHEHVTQLLDEGRVDGLLLQGRDDATNKALAGLVGSSPIVLMNSVIASRPGSVMFDDAAAARLATQTLLDRGHQRIALINGVRTSVTARRRAQGFRAALADAGLAGLRAPVSWRGYRVDDAEAGLGDVLARGRGLTGVVVSNINAAFGVLTAARHRGVSVPGDLSVIALHDAWTADHSWPPLTTIRTPLDELGARAARDLLAELLDGQQPVDTIIDRPPELVERESVGPPG